MSESTLDGLLAERAGGLEDVELHAMGSSTEVRVGATVVAVLAPGSLEVGLRPAVASAALRTPDEEPSPRGRGWIRFAPAALDGFARDRAIAWLESAVRLATEGDGPG